MNNKSTVTTGLIIFAIIVVIAIGAYLVRSVMLKDDAPVSTNTEQPSLAATADPCAPENIAATIAGLEKSTREFKDIYDIAAITLSTQLTPLVTDLQRVRREAEDYPTPVCLQLLKEYQIGSMNSSIEALKTLITASQVSVQPVPSMTQEQYDQAVNDTLTQYYALANQHIAEASNLENKYIIEKARLLGVTLPPTVTAAPPIVPATAIP
jgi:hypothetical protein